MLSERYRRPGLTPVISLSPGTKIGRPRHTYSFMNGYAYTENVGVKGGFHE